MIPSTVKMTRRSRLFRRFKPIIDGLQDKVRAKIDRDIAEWSEREWQPGGQWRQSHPFSPELALAESASGNPLTTLARAIDGVHRGDLMCVALVAIGPDGVIHTAWSDGDLAMMGAAAGFLADDLKQAASGGS